MIVKKENIIMAFREDVVSIQQARKRTLEFLRDQVAIESAVVLAGRRRRSAIRELIESVQGVGIDEIVNILDGTPKFAEINVGNIQAKLEAMLPPQNEEQPIT